MATENTASTVPARVPTTVGGRPRAPWSCRLYEAVGVPPLWVGFGVAAVLNACVLAVANSSGLLDRVISGELPEVALRAPLVSMVLIGLVPVGQLYLARWTARHLAGIQPLIRGDVPAPRSATPSRSAGLVGSAVFLALFMLPFADLRAYLEPSGWRLHTVYPWFMVAALGWLFGRLLHSILTDALAVSALARRLPSVDLLDTSPLQPFVQQGLRSALLLVLLMSVTAVLALAPGDVYLASAFLCTLVIACGVAALVVPVRGVRTRIREEKQAQLGQLRSVIDDARRTALAGGPGLERATAQLPGLIALEARLEAVREWPFDAPSLTRFAFYLLVGLGSWLGAAGVERLLDAALG